MPSIVQSAHAAGTSVSFGAGTTAGNCLAVPVLDFGSLSTPSVTAVKIGGSADNFAARSTSPGTQHGLATIWTDAGCTGGQTAVAVTMSNSSHPATFAYEFSGVVGSSELDVQDSGTGSSGTWSSGSVSTNQAVEVWIGAAVVNGSAPTGPSSPWTNTTQTSSTTDGISGYQITSSTGSAVYNGSSTSAGWAAAVVALKTPTAVSDSDTGAGADSASIAVSSADTGSGADTQALTASVPGSDTGTGADTASIGIPGSDTAAGADTATGGLLVTSSDTGSGADSGAVTSVAVTAGDTATGAETTTILASAPAADTGTGADSAVARRLLRVRWKAPDRLSTSGGTTQ